MQPNAKAMVVDDSRAIRMILRRTLADLGWDVCEAANGREAFGLMESTPGIELVLVDWNMPEVNGLEFVRLVRGRDRFRRTKLMMVTTETQVEQMTEAIEAGANEYVMKPFTKDVIAGKLRIMGLVQ